MLAWLSSLRPLLARLALPGAEVTVVLGNSSPPKEKRVTTYTVRPELRREGLKPNQNYLKMILAGADLVPNHYLQFLKSFQD